MECCWTLFTLHIYTALLADPVTFDVNARHPRLEYPLGQRTQPHFGRLTDLNHSGSRFIDMGPRPDCFRRNQGEDRIARPDDGAQFLQPRDNQRIEGSGERMMLQQRLFELKLRHRALVLHAGNFHFAARDSGIGRSNLFVTLGLFRNLVGNHLAAGQFLLAPVG